MEDEIPLSLPTLEEADALAKMMIRNKIFTAQKAYDSDFESENSQGNEK